MRRQHTAYWTSALTSLSVLMFSVKFPKFNCKPLCPLPQPLLNKFSFCLPATAIWYQWAQWNSSRRTKRADSLENPVPRDVPRVPASVSCSCRAQRWGLLPPFHVFCSLLLWAWGRALPRAWVKPEISCIILMLVFLSCHIYLTLASII